MKTMSHMHLCLLSALLLCCVFNSSFLTIDALVVGLGACRSDQIQALLEFKNEFDSRSCNHTDFVNGVRCNNATGAVKKLQLPSGCLRGTLKSNSSLFRLYHLRYLDLSYNDFTSSSLPCGFGSLNKLEVLSLSYNGFTGEVPSSISNLSQLSSLDLSSNELTGSFPLVGNLSKLYYLSLFHNHISGNIPSYLLTMPSLSTLDFTENHLTGSIQVPNSSFSSRLQNVRLGFNQLDAQILEPISKITTLVNLDLSSLNNSSPVDLRILSSLKSLAILIFQDNPILPASLSADSGLPLSLESLIFAGCDIREFPNIFRSLQRLVYVYMSDNKIKGKVPEWFWKLPRLSTVTLTNNYFTGLEGSLQVLANSSVQFLDLACNSMTGAFPIPPLNTYYLSAWNNSFSGNIPLSVCNLSSLAEVDLSYNNFTGPIPPNCLSSSLTVLNLRKNKLEGSLPDMFYAAASLKILDVGYNRLTGKLPRSLLNCSSLNFVSLDHNRFKDSFPFWLKALPNLQALTLRSNKFYGPMSPPDQGPLAFPQLRILEISDNNFTGSLAPNYFVDWIASSLQMDVGGSMYMGNFEKSGYSYDATFDLQYKGIFMEEEKIVKSYSAIDFSGNRLEGQIPESIGLLKSLIALNLSDNAFTGHIPLSLGNLTELESLDLSRNQLSGSIPQGMKSLSFLEYINVSHNQLKGEIPQGTQIIGQPLSSFEGNAGLCGLPLDESCFRTNSQPIQPEDNDEDEELMLNWKAVAIGYAFGLLLGLAIFQGFALYKPEWLAKTGLIKRRRNR